MKFLHYISGVASKSVPSLKSADTDAFVPDRKYPAKDKTQFISKRHGFPIPYITFFTHINSLPDPVKGMPPVHSVSHL